jgi:hypothetical protein
MTPYQRTEIDKILQAHHDLIGVDKVSVSLLMNAFNNLTRFRKVEDKVFEAVKYIARIDKDEITSYQKKGDIITAKFIACSILRDEGYTLRDIGCAIHVTHATVIHALKQDEFRTKTYEGYRELKNAIVARYNEINTNLAK